MFKVKINGEYIKIVFTKCHKTPDFDKDGEIFFFPINKKDVQEKGFLIFIDTKCQIFINENLVSTNFAYPCPTDQYDKWHGKKLSLTRSIENFDKRTRKEIWNKFFETFPKAK